MVDVERGLVFELCRMTIELTSPLTVGAYGKDDLTDVSCVVDANGLPSIPGSSLAGVLRHLLAGTEAPDTSERVRSTFGFQEGSEGASSRLEVSWGQIHDADDRPVPMRGAAIAGDAILRFLAAGVTRDHVRINGFGAVDDRGKFDVRSVPAGARFTFELVLHEGAPVTLTDLVALASSPVARLGGDSRCGLGGFVVSSCVGRKLDLRRRPDRDALSALKRGLHIPVSTTAELKVMPCDGGTPAGYCVGRLKLDPEDLWLIGGRDELAVGGKEVDLAPLREQRIIWSGGRGTVSQPSLVVPGTSLKGPLRHRAHYHALRRGEKMAPEQQAVTGAVDALFGRAKDDRHGVPGRIYLSDAWPSRGTLTRMNHVSLDRFSGGTLEGFLFDEGVVHGGHFEVDLVLDHRPRPEARHAESVALDAFRDALEDLIEGRLPIGAGSNRGHGYLSGKIEWLDGAPWEVRNA